MKLNFWSFQNRVIRYFCLMTLFFTLPVTWLKAQTYFFDRFGVEQGLGSSKVYAVIQDRNDRIWLGTESGASKFDGSEFENYSAANGMAGGGVMSLAEDSLGRIWFGHLNGGISLFNGERFMKLGFDSIIIDTDSDISEIKYFNGYLWISTSKNGLIRTNLPAPGDTILRGKQYKGSEGLSFRVTSSCIDSKNDLYFITDVGIRKYNKEKDYFEIFRPDSLTKFFATTYMFEDSKGNYWYGTYNGGLYKFEKSSGRMKFYDIRDGLAKQFTSFITEDYRGNIWAGSWGGGITVFTGDKMTVYNKSNGLDAAWIHCILEDREKNMIIADQYSGISIYKGDHFMTWSDATMLPDKSVFAIEEDETGNFWFGTNAGISVFNPDPDVKSKVLTFTYEKNAIGDKIRFIKSDKKNNLWIGTEDNGLVRYDLQTNKFACDVRISEKLLNYITALEIDRKGRIWVGNQDRLLMWDPEKEQAQIFSQNDGLVGSWISSLYCDADGNLWIGSESSPKMGLTKYISSSGKFQVIDIGEGFVPRTIEETFDGTIWVGTTNGLLGIKDDKVVFHLNEGNGLLSNNINLLQPQGRDYLYIGTNYGLNRFSFSDSTIALFTKRNGFTGIETKPNATLRDSRGSLWFGTANGVTRLDPSRMPPVSTVPMTHIGNMTVNYKPHQMTEGLKLNYKENSVLFNFYSICVANPDAVRYRYKLKGSDEDWSPATSNTIKDYSALSPGHYTFLVTASNSYGYWNRKPAEYSFTVKPPFWQTPWFIGACIILAAFGIMSYIKIRERNLIREKKILEKKVAERTAEVVQKSMEIEEKNRDITASIRYAERIQRAMLPGEDTFPETFVLYMPKDIVSGDFYWMFDNGELQFIAACDCTGHGVPGAFMSIIGYNSLNKVVREYGITQPGPILDQLNYEIVTALMQRHEETIKDGMDMALVAFDRKKFTMEFAGAYNPLYVVRKGEVFTYKSDRFPIGMSSQQAKKSFRTQSVDIQPGDMVYLSSDGYADQFGSVSSKKFKSGNVKKLLCEIWDLPVNDQKARLAKEILEWKGDYPQIDDIMFIGTRIPEI